MGDGKKDQVTGRVKEAAGALLDDEELKNEGKADQAAGDLKDKAGEVIDKIKNIVTGNDD